MSGGGGLIPGQITWRTVRFVTEFVGVLKFCDGDLRVFFALASICGLGELAWWGGQSLLNDFKSATTAANVVVTNDYPDPLTHVEPKPDERTIKRITCPPCAGTGQLGGGWLCKKCHGKAFIETKRHNQPKCVPCNGTGRYRGKAEYHCIACNGIGRIPFGEGDEEDRYS